MQPPWKIINLELHEPIPQLTLPNGYQGILAIFCWQGIPLGDCEIAADELPMNATQVLNLALDAIASSLGSQLFNDCFQGNLPVDIPEFFCRNAPDFQKLIQFTRPLETLKDKWERPTNNNISVVVCTRDRPKRLKNCLRSLQNLKTSPQEIIVVDNAPSSDATRKIVDLFPQFQYILEPSPGLSIARNTGIRHSRGEIIAFTDDDLVVHPNWLTRLQSAFEQPEIMAVTGLMLPAELETEAQVRFYQNNSDTRWQYKPLLFNSKFFRGMQPKGVPVWRIGAGANMAFRSEIFQMVGNFNEILGAGAAGCSEDSEMWYRILAEGWECHYEPTAVVFHYHRSDLDSYAQQMYQYMQGHITALLVQFDRYRHWGNLRRILIALPRYYTRRLFRKYLKGDRQFNQTLESEIAGCLAGLKYYWQHKSQTKTNYDIHFKTKK